MIAIDFTHVVDQDVQKFIISSENKEFLFRNIVRCEGTKTIALVNDTLLIKNRYTPVHNDFLALIFILAFHPIIDSEDTVEIRFPFKVSRNFYNTIKVKWILPNIIINDTHLQNDKPIYENSTKVLCYGGGMDSLSVKLMLNGYNDVKYIHQVDKFDENVHNENDLIYLETNIRTLYSVYGLPLWVSIMICGIINNCKEMYCGAQLTSSYLLDGNEYKDRTKNLWLTRVMKNINIDVCTFTFMTEINNAQVVYYYDKYSDVKFCSISSNSVGKCHKCTKCLRKFLLMATFDKRYIKDVDMFDLNDKRFIDYFNRYKIYFADIFKFCVDKIGVESKNINIIKNYLSKYDISDITFHSKYYKENLDAYPEELKQHILVTLDKIGVKPMDNKDIQNMRSYVQKPKKIELYC